MKPLKFAITGNYPGNDFHYIIKLARLSILIEHSCTHAPFKFSSYHNLRSSAIAPNTWTSETAVWSRNLNAAQSSARCAESYWVITSPVSLNLLIHLAVFSSTSRTTTTSPLSFLNFHLLRTARFFLTSISFSTAFWILLLAIAIQLNFGMGCSSEYHAYVSLSSSGHF